MLTKTQIQDWMTQPVVTVPPNHPITTAHQLMKDKQIRRLVVVDGDNVLGLITRGDIREAKPSDATTLSIWELNYLIGQLTVDKVMTREVFRVRPEDSIGKAAQLMLDNKISGLPVVDANDKLVGIITESDIFRMLIAALDE